MTENLKITRWGNIKNIARNIEIVTDVLNGLSISVVAKKYGLNRQMPRIITAKFCRLSNIELYNQMPDCKTVDIEFLRKNKDNFIKHFPGREDRQVNQ